MSLGGAYDELVSKSFQGSMTKLGISTACAQFAFDAYNNGLTSKQTAVSAMKSTLSIAINFATEPIQLAYLGVGIIDLALTEVSTYAIATRYESIKNMYDEYYQRDGISRTVGDWRKLFKKTYKENQSKPQEALDMMNAEIDRYVQEYWEVAGADWNSWIESYDKNAFLSKYPWPYEDDRNNISNTYKEELYSFLQTVFHTISRDIYFDGLNAREKELKAMARLLNSQYAIRIVEEVQEGDRPKWAGCYARLAPLSDSADEKAWTGKLDGEGGGTIRFTLLVHQRAGFPMTLELYETVDDVKKGKVALSVPIEPFKESEQTVVLGNEGLSLDDIIGTYTVTVKFRGEKQQGTFIFSKNGASLTATDERGGTMEMSYDPATGTAFHVRTIPNDDDEITLKTTFVFKLENGSVKMSGEGVQSTQEKSQSAQYEGYKTD